MPITYQTKNDRVTDIFKEHAEARLQALRKLSKDIVEIRVVLSQQRGQHSVELTLAVNGTIVRSEERDPDPLTSFDRALDKVRRQLEHLRFRVDRKAHHGGKAAGAEGEAALAAVEPEEEEYIKPQPVPEFEGIKIVRTKSHVLKPMSPEEAALEMELIGHDFYVFCNDETERMGVVYRRRAGGYGLIEPEMG